MTGTLSGAINHGLSYTPSADEFTITLTEDPINSPRVIIVGSITSTQFTVTCENDVGASNLDFGWSVKRV